MTERTQFATGMATDDPGNAAVVLESRGLQKTYGSGEKSICVLADANLSLRRGEMVAIVAPSGAGKSTLLHLLAALSPESSADGLAMHLVIPEWIAYHHAWSFDVERLAWAVMFRCPC